MAQQRKEIYNHIFRQLKPFDIKSSRDNNMAKFQPQPPSPRVHFPPLPPHKSIWDHLPKRPPPLGAQLQAGPRPPMVPRVALLKPKPPKTELPPIPQQTWRKKRVEPVKPPSKFIQVIEHNIQKKEETPEVQWVVSDVDEFDAYLEVLRGEIKDMQKVVFQQKATVMSLTTKVIAAQNQLVALTDRHRSELEGMSMSNEEEVKNRRLKHNLYNVAAMYSGLLSAEVPLDPFAQLDMIETCLRVAKCLPQKKSAPVLKD